MNINVLFKKSSIKFYILLVVFSIPFWVAGEMAKQLSKFLPMNLPVSALMAFCPIIVALILVYSEDNADGIKGLLRRAFDYRGIKQKIWFTPILFLMPSIMLISYWAMLLMGRSLPEPRIPIMTIPILFAEFFIASVCEEVGWMGYVADTMLQRWSALKTGTILGLVWAIWHSIPYIQTHHGLTWIICQSLTAVLARILIVWLYNNNGKSVLAAILFHTMLNISVTLFPNNGSHYDPAVTWVIMLVAVIVLTLLWGPKTLANYRYVLLSKNT